MRWFGTLLCLGALLIGLPSWADGPKVHDVAERVDRHYNALSSLRTEFTETYRGGGVSRSESGVMYLKKPGRMRWDYQTPQKKVFLSDGKTAWFYVPGERQARRSSIKSLEDFRSPLRYLLGHSKLEKEFHDLSIVTPDAQAAPGNVVLSGIPKGMEDRVQNVRLEIAPDGSIVRITLSELDGALTEFRFQHSEGNVKLSDASFKFVPPPGV
ncbi:MAG TPA: outer membrane lipoprotein chaperone LolA, partial [Terriglobales bacterium]|nr:outer membrane lipoprotein chaperone LolA [Terriglobales bacterium]